jgi:hypothetical protein
MATATNIVRVEVTVTVYGDDGNPEQIARRMVEDAIASRPLDTNTFVSQSDIRVVN